ncbi:MAG: hypothetical protein AABW58_04655 [Nanoarchaeota archaeon]
MKNEEHVRNIKESLSIIEECIEKGLLERQRNIGFNTSAASVDMLELLLHKKSLIDPGFLVKHEWLNSKNKIEEKFPFEFEKKDEILGLMSKIESKRSLLCYGKQQKIELIQEVIDNFNKLRKKFNEVGLDEF